MSKQEEKKPSGQEKEEVKKGSKEALLAEEILVSTFTQINFVLERRGPDFEGKVGVASYKTQRQGHRTERQRTQLTQLRD